MGERPGMAEDAESEVLQGPESGGLGVCEECSYVLLRRATQYFINEAGKSCVQGNIQDLNYAREASG